jgi:glycosyltransferase involved in cell wall biosynthesis
MRSLRVDQVLVSELIGGAASIGLRLAQFVNATGGHSRVWLPGEGAASRELRRLAIPWKRYRLDQMNGNPLTHGLACLRMSTGFWARRCLVHVHTPYVYRLIRPALRIAGVPTIVHVHLEYGAEDLQWAFQDSPEMVVTCARYLADSVQTIIDNRKSVVPVLAVQNAVELEKFRPGDRESAKIALGAPANKPLVLMMANIAPHKGQATALHAVALLRSHGITAECWFAGEEREAGGGFRLQLQQLARELHVSEQVRFLGFRTDGPDLLRAADILLLPSTREGLPISVLEAQATKTAVIGAPHPGILEVVEDQQTGFIVNPEDYEGYADRMRMLLTQPQLYSRIVDCAFERVLQRHSWASFSEKMLNAYRKVLAG